MCITLLIAFLFSMLSLFGQEWDSLLLHPYFVKGTVDDINLDTTSGTKPAVDLDYSPLEIAEPGITVEIGQFDMKDSGVIVLRYLSSRNYYFTKNSI